MHHKRLKFLLNFFFNFSLVLCTYSYVSCHLIRKKSFTTENYSGRIVGGIPVEISQYPSAAQFYNFGSLCAGTILNSWVVVTAGHCFDHHKELYDMVVKVEAKYTFDPNAMMYDVLDFVIHEAYNQTMRFSCDIALLFVEGPMKLGEKSRKAVIVNSNKWMNSLETNFSVVGWGWTKYGGPVSQVGLKKTELRFVSTSKCSEMHHLPLTPDMFCLYGEGMRDTCKGDSGGGVLWNGMLVGIVSFGDGCAKKNKPSVYSNIWYFRKWIEETIKKIFKSYCLKYSNYTALITYHSTEI